ncbi:hypothetical protein ACFL21_03820 [Patescibacteria group bacterium]
MASYSLSHEIARGAEGRVFLSADGKLSVFLVDIMEPLMDQSLESQ